MTGKILIVDALSAGEGQRKSSRDTIGCGPRTVAGVFEKHKIPCHIQRAEQILSAKSPFKGFDHLAISAMTMDSPVVRRIAGYWKRARKTGRIIIGGPITAAPSLLSESLADLFVLGEGEATLDDLLQRRYLNEKIDLSAVKGIAYLSSGRVKLTARRPFLSENDLSDIFVPSATRIIDYVAYQASKVYVEVVRGCSNYRRTRLPLNNGTRCSECGHCDSPHPEVRMDCPEDIPPGCGFCSVPGTWGPPRSRSVKAIVSEVNALVNLGVHRIVLEAPGFLDYQRGTHPQTNPCSPPANLAALRELFTGLNAINPIATGDVHLAIENMKACLFTEQVAQTLVDCSISSSPNIGLETGSEEHLQKIGKCGSTSDVLEAVRVASKFGMKPFVYFIYGLPGESEATIKASVDMMRKLSAAGVERFILYGFRPLPGSAFEGYPASSQDDPLGQMLRKEVEQINRLSKDSYLGQTIRGIAAEPSWSRHGYTMVYPLGEGPLMTVAGGFSPGTPLSVRVTKVLSSSLLLGEADGIDRKER